MPVKIICVGEQGIGKTCTQAPLVTLGYKLYTMDFDNGSETLMNLLKDKDHYPYYSYCLKHNIDPDQAVSICPIDQKMVVGEIERVQKDPNGRVIKVTKELALKPADAEAFSKTARSLMDWQDNKGQKLGGIYSWDDSIVFTLDTVGSMARFGYYYHQKLNGRLGAIEDGFDHQRDVGGAQSWVRRIIEVLFSNAVKCNVIIFTHIDWIDKSRGYAQTPQERDRKEQSLNLEGVPSIIGQALGPKIGKYFNNVFLVEQSGSGSSVERKIWTVPHDRITCKRSAWLQDSYDTSTGMAEIFSQLTGKPLPQDFLSELGQQKAPAAAAVPVPLRAAGGSSRPAPLKLGG